MISYDSRKSPRVWPRLTVYSRKVSTDTVVGIGSDLLKHLKVVPGFVVSMKIYARSSRGVTVDAATACCTSI